MPIEFACQVCKQTIRVPDGNEGRRTKCPNCSAIQPIPGGPAASGDAYSAGGAPQQPANPFADSTSSSPSQPNLGESPYASPYAAHAGSMAVGFDEAKQKLAVPAIVCMALVGIMSALSVLSLLMFCVLVVAGEERDRVGFAMNIGFSALAIFFDIITLVALYKGSQMQSSAMAWAGFILAMIPCTTGVCCIFVMPFSIWGMVALSDAEVQRHFQG